MGETIRWSTIPYSYGIAECNGNLHFCKGNEINCGGNTVTCQNPTFAVCGGESVICDIGETNYNCNNPLFGDDTVCKEFLPEVSKEIFENTINSNKDEVWKIYKKDPYSLALSCELDTIQKNCDAGNNISRGCFSNAPIIYTEYKGNDVIACSEAVQEDIRCVNKPNEICEGFPYSCSGDLYVNIDHIFS